MNDNDDPKLYVSMSSISDPTRFEVLPSITIFNFSDYRDKIICALNERLYKFDDKFSLCEGFVILSSNNKRGHILAVAIVHESAEIKLFGLEKLLPNEAFDRINENG